MTEIGGRRNQLHCAIGRGVQFLTYQVDFPQSSKDKLIPGQIHRFDVMHTMSSKNENVRAVNGVPHFVFTGYFMEQLNTCNDGHLKYDDDWVASSNSFRRKNLSLTMRSISNYLYINRI